MINPLLQLLLIIMLLLLLLVLVVVVLFRCQQPKISGLVLGVAGRVLMCLLLLPLLVVLAPCLLMHLTVQMMLLLGCKGNPFFPCHWAIL